MAAAQAAAFAAMDSIPRSCAALPSTSSSLRRGPSLLHVSAARRALPSLRIKAANGKSDEITKDTRLQQEKGVETRLMSAAVGMLPLMLAFVEAELPRAIPVETFYSDWTLSELALKSFYMIFVCVFSWGAVVFASMNDPYYESDEYRNAGGNGTQHWIYTRAEEEEQEAREELWREELRKEIEDKLGEVKELESAEKKEKELV